MIPSCDDEWLSLHPSFPEEEERSRAFLAQVASEIEDLAGEAFPLSPDAFRDLKEGALRAARATLGAAYQPVCASVSLLCDLAVQGWGICVEGREIRLKRPVRSEDLQEERNRVRRALGVSRREQLSEPAVRDFVESMEARRLGPDGEWRSIFSLMRDGMQLAAQIEKVRREVNPGERRKRLDGVIAPYLQFVTEDARCEWTGLKLTDVWRYFRYTWLTPARSTPGRSMMILVRDTAVEPHPD